MKIAGDWDTNDLAYLAGLIVKYNADLNRLREINARADKEIDRLNAEIERLKGEQVLDKL